MFRFKKNPKTCNSPFILAVKVNKICFKLCHCLIHHPLEESYTCDKNTVNFIRFLLFWNPNQKLHVLIKHIFRFRYTMVGFSTSN